MTTEHDAVDTLTDPTGDHVITHEELNKKGEFVVTVDGVRAGEMTYSRASDTLVIVDHTLVEDDFRGRGLASALVRAGVEWARAEGTKILPLCPYAKAYFQRHPDDVADVWSR